MNSVPVAKIDLQTAADELGVHYQTAYRWVRSGRLNAEMVRGRYLVSPQDLAILDESRDAPRTPPPPKASRLDHAAERMYEALIAGDETAAMKIGRRLIDEGTPIKDLIQSVLVPPLHQIGMQWHTGALTIWEEHRASSIVERLIGNLAPNPRGRRRGTAVVMGVAGDRHSLPTTMAAVVLRADHWRVHHLGSDLPTEQIEKFCKQNDVDLAVLTVTNPDVRRLAESIAEGLQSAGTPCVVGGSGQTLDALLEMALAAR